MVKLNSTPEILLKKRKNADRIRLEKQEASRKKRELQKKQKHAKKNRFVRAETLVATSLATGREKERLKRISKIQAKKNVDDVAHLPSTKDFILKITEAETVDEDDEEDDGLVKEKSAYNGEPTLLFVIRVKGPTAVKLPAKVFKILSTMRLVELNTGVFIKLTATTYPMLKLIAPYVVIGRPSLSSIRSIVQKRARVEIDGKDIILNDNNIVEEKLGDSGIICIEDIIHEISSLGELFSKVNHFMLPFKLQREVSGFSAMARLQKLKLKEHKDDYKVSNSGVAPVIEVDIDALISKLN